MTIFATVLVKMDKGPFGAGAMRECFAMKKLSWYVAPILLPLTSSVPAEHRLDSFI